MKTLFSISVLLLLFSSFIRSQEPLPVLSSRWERTTLQAPKGNVSPIVPARPVTAENKYFQRKAREQRTDNPLDPYEASIEGRSAAMEKAVQESRAARADNAKGYSYFAEVRNDTGKTIDVIFWEYAFTEKARPSNVVRRQFLCGIKLHDGDKKELSVFSLLGPTDTIDAESLAKAGEKPFDEKVIINRIEFSDGAILQRHGWKFEDVRERVKRVTSTPWVNETCRIL